MAYHDTDIRSMSPTHADFLPQLKAIGQSLKKRFFKKPNISEAIDQYYCLCQDLKRDCQDEYAAICVLEIAKCHESLQNYTERANMLVKAAKYFLEAKDAQSPYETDDSILHISSQGKLQVAIQYLSKASQLYQEHRNQGLALICILMIAETLYRAKHYGEALKYYQSARNVTSSFFTLTDQLVIVECIVKCKIKMSELESALKTVDEFLEKLRKPQGEFLVEFQQSFTLRLGIMRVCLILILGMDSKDLAQFVWPQSSTSGGAENERVPRKEDEILIELRSLVLAVEEGNVKEMIRIRDTLSPLLTEIEFELFSILVQLYS